MKNEGQYCVYIMTNKHNTVLYTGVTNNLHRRVLEHRNGEGSAFTKKYNIMKLVYFECGSSIDEAILREKQIKAAPHSEASSPLDEGLFEHLFHR